MNEYVMNDNELIGRFNISVAKSIMKECVGKKPLSFKDIEISQSAMVTIGQAINQMALELEVPTTTLNKQMSKVMYDINNDLVFIFSIADVECVVSIPFGYWKYRNENGSVQ